MVNLSYKIGRRKKEENNSFQHHTIVACMNVSKIMIPSFLYTVFGQHTTTVILVLQVRSTYLMCHVFIVYTDYEVC